MLARCRTTRRRLVVLFLDIDNFKDINDTLGHEAGDEVLETIATRLEAQLRDGEVIGRMGGDEFVVLVGSKVSDDAIAAVAKRLRAAAARPSGCIGEEGPLVHIHHQHRGRPGTARQCQRTVPRGRHGSVPGEVGGSDAWVSFVPEMRSSALQRLQLQSELATAHSERQFALLFQPIFDLHWAGWPAPRRCCAGSTRRGGP